MDSINIALAPDDNYAKHCAIVMASAMVNASEGSEINFYILDGGLNEENKRALGNIKTGRKYNLEFLRIDADAFKNFPEMSYITVSTWYRLKIASLLPPEVTRILYLDCDTVVTAPLNELFEMDMEGCLIGGATDNMWRRYSKKLGLPSDYRYFNAGVLLVNVEAWRNEGIEEKLFAFLSEDTDRLKLMDQSVLNIFMGDRAKRLGLKWNFQYIIPFLDDTCFFYKETLDEYISAMTDHAIIHFMGEYKPWKDDIGTLHPFRNEYFKYLKYTQWKLSGDEERAHALANSKFRRGKFWRRLAHNIAHKPMLVFRKYYLGGIYLKFKSLGKGGPTAHKRRRILG